MTTFPPFARQNSRKRKRGNAGHAWADLRWNVVSRTDDVCTKVYVLSLEGMGARAYGNEFKEGVLEVPLESGQGMRRLAADHRMSRSTLTSE